MADGMRRVQRSYRFGEETARLIADSARASGMSQTEWLSMAASAYASVDASVGASGGSEGDGALVAELRAEVEQLRSQLTQVQAVSLTQAQALAEQASQTRALLEAPRRWRWPWQRDL